MNKYLFPKPRSDRLAAISYLQDNFIFRVMTGGHSW